MADSLWAHRMKKDRRSHDRLRPLEAQQKEVHAEYLDTLGWADKVFSDTYVRLQRDRGGELRRS